MPRVEFKVSFPLPPDATIADARAYVVDAVATMRGCYRPAGAYGDDDPGDPMQPLDGDKVRVTHIRKRRK